MSKSTFEHGSTESTETEKKNGRKSKSSTPLKKAAIIVGGALLISTVGEQAVNQSEVAAESNEQDKISTVEETTSASGENEFVIPEPGDEETYTADLSGPDNDTPETGEASIEDPTDVMNKILQTASEEFTRKHQGIGENLLDHHISSFLSDGQKIIALHLTGKNEVFAKTIEEFKSDVAIMLVKADKSIDAKNS